AVAVPELEMQFAVRFGPERFDTEFLKGLAQGRLPGRLARIDLAAGPVDLARSETALLADEQNLFLPHDEEEIGVDARLTGCTFSHVAEESYTLSVGSDTGLMRWG